MDSTLVLVRHGESEWNKLNLFTGWKDVDLTEQGVSEAHRAGRLMHAQGMKFDIAYTSLLKRANRTLEIILSELGQADLQSIRDEALNERDYGELTGLNKDDARERWGEEQVLIWRRSFDIPPPGGESLKGTAARVLPYFDAHIKPQLDAGKSIIVAAHGNSLRALLMQLEQLTPEEILQVNIATGEPLVYRLGSGGAIIEKRELVA